MKSWKQKKYRVSPYLFSLFMIGNIGMIFCCGLFFYFTIPSEKPDSVANFLSEWFVCFAFMLIILVIYLIACIYEGYCLSGSALFTSNAIVLTAPLRKKIVMKHSEIRAIGINYGIVNGKPQFWIYASKRKIPQYLWGKFTKAPISAIFIRIEYRPCVFDDLMQTLPLDLQKELIKGKSVLTRVK